MVIIAVAPLAGAWIEICNYGIGSDGRIGRSPCGSVDGNTKIILNIIVLIVAPLAGAWIEICIIGPYTATS